MDPTEPPYSTTSFREAKGPSSLEKQVAGPGNAKAKQAGLLGPNQEATRPNNPPAPQEPPQSGERNTNTAPDRPDWAWALPTQSQGPRIRIRAMQL
jgi:hypothetical protein